MHFSKYNTFWHTRGDFSFFDIAHNVPFLYYSNYGLALKDQSSSLLGEQARVIWGDHTGEASLDPFAGWLRWQKPSGVGLISQYPFSVGAY